MSTHILDHPPHLTAEWLCTQISLNRDDPVPLYHQLEQQLLRLIERGELRPGDRIPGDVPLSAGLKLNNRTVRQALSRLAARGLIRRVRRAGTFVNEPRRAARDTIGFFYFAENAMKMSERAEAVQQYAASQGADFKMVAFSKDFYERVDLLDEATRMGLKGLITVPLLDAACKRNLLRLENAGFPYVRLGNPHYIGELKAPLVRGDWVRAMRDSVDYLRAYGHRRIGLTTLGLPEAAELKAYDACMSDEASYQDRWKLVIPSDGTLEMMNELPLTAMLQAYLTANPDVTAICSTSLGRRLAAIAPSLGRQVPQSLSLLNFGLNTLAGNIALTTMLSPIRPMGEAAAYKLFDIMRHGPPAREEIINIPLQLVEGESVAPPSQTATA